MFKLALNAGHHLGEAKGIPLYLNPNDVREWWLNDRVADKVEKLLANYDGIEVLRIDDTTGKTDVPLKERTDKANAWGADFYLAIHHNGGIYGGSGGGITAHIYIKASTASKEWQKALYDALIEETGLKGNRAEPLQTDNFHEVRETAMPAVLLELGYMDSTTDVPIILTEEYADKCAEAIVKVIVKKAQLTKKPAPKSKTISFAELQKKLKAEGYTTITL